MRLSLPGILLISPACCSWCRRPSAFYTDWLWFRELGYEGIFLRTLNAQFAVFAGDVRGGLPASCISTSGSRAGTLQRPHIVLGTGVDGRPIALDGRRLAGLALPARRSPSRSRSGCPARANWLTWLSFFNAVPFGQRDPLFGRDVAFYVFKLPRLPDRPAAGAGRRRPHARSAAALYYVLSGSFVIESRPRRRRSGRASG